MTDDEKRARVAELREHWAGDRRVTVSRDRMVWLCDELLRALDACKAAQPAEGDWETRRAGEFIDRLCDHYGAEWPPTDESPLDDLARLLRDCWGSGHLDGQGDPVADAAARAVAERCVELANHHDDCPLCVVLNRRAGEPRHSRHCPVAAYERTGGG